MKKIIIALVALTLMLTAFAACGGKDGHEISGSGGSGSIADTGGNESTASEMTSEEKDAWGNVSIDMGGGSQSSSTSGSASTSTPTNSTPSGSGTSSTSGSGSSSNAGNSSSSGSSSSSVSSGSSSSSSTSSSSQTSDKDSSWSEWIPF